MIRLMGLLAGLFVSSLAQAQNAQQLLDDSDRARGGLDSGISWDIEIDSSEDGVAAKRSYRVKAKGVDAYVEITAPARSKGEIMLFNDRAFWFFKPGLRKPVSISARQKLSGQAANGDIATTDYVRDYDGTIVGEEKVGTEDAFKLELKAKSKNVTYDRIRYWVSKSRHYGIKAEFLTLQGDVFKTATFEYNNKAMLDGKEYEFVSRMTINDPAMPGNVTKITYGKPRREEHPASLFNVNNLVR